MSKLTLQEFVKIYADEALNTQKKYNVPASVSLVHFYIESGGASSVLTSTYNNFSGIKATPNWVKNGGKAIYLLTWENLNFNPRIEPNKLKDSLGKPVPPQSIREVKYNNQTKKFEVRFFDAFRAYDTAQASFDDYGKLLQQLPRYKKAFDFVEQPKLFFAELLKGGYATANSKTYQNSFNSLLDKLLKEKMLDNIPTNPLSVFVPLALVAFGLYLFFQ